MIPLLITGLLTDLAKNGLGLLGNAVLNKGKNVIEEKLGVSLDTEMVTAEGRQALLQLQTDNEQFLITAATENRKIDLEFYKSESEDSANARNTNSSIQESSNASWLAKNTIYIIAFIVISGGGYMLYTAQAADVRMAAVASITMVLGFFFGTTANSKSKDTAIANMAHAANPGVAK